MEYLVGWQMQLLVKNIISSEMCMFIFHDETIHNYIA